MGGFEGIDCLGDGLARTGVHLDDDELTVRSFWEIGQMLYRSGGSVADGSDDGGLGDREVGFNKTLPNA